MFRGSDVYPHSSSGDEYIHTGKHIMYFYQTQHLYINDMTNLIIPANLVTNQANYMDLSINFP